MASSHSEFNPYAPPKTDPMSKLAIESELGGDGFYWREGAVLVVRHMVTLPRRCIKCNDEADGPPYVKKLSWHPPGWYILVVLSLWLYVLIYFFVRHKGVVEVSLCSEHRQRRRTMITVAWGLALLGFVTIGFAVNLESAALGFTAFGLIVTGLIVGAFGSRLLWPQRIDSSMMWLKGAGEPYLASLELGSPGLHLSRER